MPKRFDKAYYDRYYRNPKTRSTTPAAVGRQATFIHAYLRHLELEVSSVLDIGCGTGNLLRALGRAYPRASCSGVEYSDYLCRHYGWTQGSVDSFMPLQPADLVICNDVLGYLDEKRCIAALKNLSEMTATTLYLGVLTTQDVPISDRTRTDSSQITRSVSFYRKQLGRHFVAVGGGLFIKQPLPATIWHLDRA